MTEIDVYILPEQQTEERLRFACRLGEKLFRLSRAAYFHVDSEDQAHGLGELLWSYRKEAFLPHTLCREGEQTEASTALTIGWQTPPQRCHDVLVNLGTTIPTWFSRFERVSEIVIQAPEIRDAMRENYRFYKDRGYSITNHDMRR